MKEFPQEEVRKAFQKAPEPIREVFLAEETAEIIFQIKEQHKLHVDVAGILGAQIGYLLLGLVTPAEFFGNLMLGGTDEKVARAVMEEINTRIFLPLREKMRTEASSSAPNVPSTPVYTPPVRPEPVAPTVAPAPVPTISTQPVYAPVPTIDVPMQPSTPEVTAPVQTQQVRTMAHDMAALKEHGGFSAPLPSAWNDSGTTLPHLEPVTPMSVPAHTQTPTPVPSASTPIQKTYGTDPYREPVV